MQSLPPALLCRYDYDPLDRITRHILPDNHQRQRFYCKSRLASEIHGTTHYSIIQHHDQLLAQKQSDGNEVNTTLLVTDQQRSVLQTIKANHPRQPIAYSPYGYGPPGNGLLSLLGFNGERPDPVTGCYLLGNGYRALNPALMRFNSPDSLSPFEKGGLNPYTYCLGDPINAIDPNGHTPVAMKAMSSTLIFKKVPGTQLVKVRVEKTITEVTLETINYDKHGLKSNTLELYYETGISTRNKPFTIFNTHPFEGELKYNTTLPSSLDKNSRSTTANLVPGSVDEMNLRNHAFKIEHNLTRAGMKGEKFMPTVKKMVRRDLINDNIRGVFREKISDSYANYYGIRKQR
ncbi:RHS repeat-associated core domain protein-containing protein [Pseudomonas sp. GM78]|uniref:RHS repeat-associated core domain-containing protein n=1 Tax=Pseudomonas sp. GM78 TaxID=1144337 RepID=UPI0002706A56|nr:RHS repeat-associated core domain-containing protein [Pseudomonas sp. GM78]EJN27511.1 RHS repeat-associated core domain protein-containing protein [Pseudomonas sp. GM78]